MKKLQIIPETQKQHQLIKKFSWLLASFRFYLKVIVGIMF